MRLFHINAGGPEWRWVLAPTPEQAQVALLSALGYEPHETERVLDCVEQDLDVVAVLPTDYQAGKTDPAGGRDSSAH